ncbi:M56 family metallopeptidase [Dyadobacter crusticola]|uniref:M56 family metallopeptidase n=1 Tax=Dyadobacter crusticola TaxID=292407 RepID=UPI00068B69C5|nr:M56 family metallopeptidase [Dyadobacter crusticola]
METLIYLAKTNLYLVLFYCCYWLFFRRHTFFQWNRVYLLSSIAASFLLPLIVFYTPIEIAAQSTEMVQQVAVNAVAPVPQEEQIGWAQLLVWAYASVSAFMLAKLLRSFQRLFVLIKNGERIQLEAYTLIFLDQKHTKKAGAGSFSFFKWLVVNRADYENNPDTILRHEHVHIRQWHSLDISLIEIIKIVFWANPVVWLYKKSLQTVHEYLADEEAANRDSYAHFLVSYALKVPEQVLTNHFSNASLLKDRIKMIYKTRTSKWLLSKYLLIFPLALATIFLTAAREYIPMSPASKPELANANVVKGKVSDQNGKPVPGANVIIKNTTQGAATDLDGNFELQNVPAGASLVVSHIQFKSKEVAVTNNKSTYTIVIEPDDTVLKGPTITAVANTPKPNVAKTAAPNAKPANRTFMVAEQKPEFPGGHEAMIEFLKTNTKYPAPALKANVEGTVIVRFTVDKEGTLSNILIVKGVGFGLDGESVRLVKSMPKWKPGIQNGEPLEMTQTIEIKFDLASAKGDKRQGFHLPQSSFIQGFQLAKVDVEDLFNSSLAFFEGKSFKPSLNTPTASYQYVPDSSSYRFMNYNNRVNGTTYSLRPSGAVKFRKQSTESNN